MRKSQSLSRRAAQRESGDVHLQKKQQKSRWIHCPSCGGKTRNKVYQDTVLVNFPLFCPKCRKETLIDVVQFKMIIKKWASRTIRRACILYWGYRLFSVLLDFDSGICPDRSNNWLDDWSQRERPPLRCSLLPGIAVGEGQGCPAEVQDKTPPVNQFSENESKDTKLPI